VAGRFDINTYKERRKEQNTSAEK
jgi:hypothetical protein